jgi:hypothetical protein
MSLKNNSGLPTWVKWKAQDADGAWWGYSVEPLKFDNGWYENEVGQRIKIKQCKSNPSWKNSLIKITTN